MDPEVNRSVDSQEELPMRHSLWQGWQPPKMYEAGPRDIRHTLAPILPPACIFTPVETSRPLRVDEKYPECMDSIADFCGRSVEFRTNNDLASSSSASAKKSLSPEAVGYPDFLDLPDVDYEEISPDDFTPVSRENSRWKPDEKPKTAVVSAAEQQQWDAVSSECPADDVVLADRRGVDDDDNERASTSAGTTRFSIFEPPRDELSSLTSSTTVSFGAVGSGGVRKFRAPPPTTSPGPRRRHDDAAGHVFDAADMPGGVGGRRHNVVGSVTGFHEKAMGPRRRTRDGSAGAALVSSVRRALAASSLAAADEKTSAAAPKRRPSSTPPAARKASQPRRQQQHMRDGASGELNDNPTLAEALESSAAGNDDEVGGDDAGGRDGLPTGAEVDGLAGGANKQAGKSKKDGGS